MEQWLRKRYIRQLARELWEGSDGRQTFNDLVTEQHMSDEEADAFIENNVSEARKEERKLNEWLDGGGEITGV